MKTILVVSYHFPPEEGSCSEKNTRIVQLLLDQGYKVVVLTKPGFTEPIENPNLKVIRTKKLGIFHKTENQGNCVQTHSIVHELDNNKIKSILSSIIIPDGTIDWFYEVKKFYRKNKIEFENIDLILSISSPYSAHLVSRYLAKKIKVPYIMSYGDPWIYEPKRKRGKFRYAIEHSLERDLIKNSSGVLVITNWNKLKYQQLYKIPETKISTFHIGYNKSDIIESTNKKDEKFRIIYGGSLDPVHRDPKPFVEALHEIERVKVTIYNNDSNELPQLIHDNEVSKKISHVPLISSSDFLKEMYKNDALLLFGNRTPFQVPGKVFTYIATGKTIIYLKNNDFVDDGTEEVLKKYGNAIILKNEKQDIIKGMNTFLKETLQSPRYMNREIFEFHNTMKPIVEMIKEILDA